MDDLISRAQMSEAIRDYLKDLITKGIHEVEITEFNVDVQNIIEVQPTAYNVDKVLEQIKELRNYCDKTDCKKCKYKDTCFDAEMEKIIKAGGVNG